MESVELEASRFPLIAILQNKCSLDLLSVSLTGLFQTLSTFITWAFLESRIFLCWSEKIHFKFGEEFLLLSVKAPSVNTSLKPGQTVFPPPYSRSSETLLSTSRMLALAMLVNVDDFKHELLTVA